MSKIKSLMKIALIVTILTSLIACNNSKEEIKIPNKNYRESIEKDIIGIWELLKQNYKPSDEPSLIDPDYIEYLEIKPDGNCQDGRNKAKWFLSYSDNFVIDSTSKVILITISNRKRNSWGEYDRKIEVYQIKITIENDTKYLYMTSLESSATRIFIRKN
jgi:hypothetical protein